MKKNIKKILTYLGLISFPTAAAVVSTISFNDSVQSINEDLEEINNNLDEIEQTHSEIKEDLKDIKNDLDEIEADLREVEEYVGISYFTEEVEASKDEQIALEYFDTLKHDVTTISSYENVERFKDSITQSFIYLTDFIFFDGELEGIKFKDLTTETKASVITTYVEIDELIMSIYPNYKENLSDKYDSVKQFFTELYESNLSEEAKQNIENTTSNVSEVVDMAGGYAGDVYDTAKTKVKTWYTDFKTNHQ